MLRTLLPVSLVVLLFHANVNAQGQFDPVLGPSGINSLVTGLTGDGISIGQLEIERPGSFMAPDNGLNSNSGTVVSGGLFVGINGTVVANSTAQIFGFDANGMPQQESHATEVAGLVISRDLVAPGVAQDATLFAHGLVGGGADVNQFGGQLIATQDNDRVVAINISYATSLGPSGTDGNTDFTQFVDWSARTHDVLYVVANGNRTNRPFDALVASPSDNFNGITVGASTQDVFGVFNTYSNAVNRLVSDAQGERTSIDILAPGEGVRLPTAGSPIPAPVGSGTSYAAPLVTGTAALLAEFGENRPLGSRFDGDHLRHEVLKAVILNSADKLVDDGTVQVNGQAVPVGGLLGMDRTVFNSTGGTWLDSFAFPNSPDSPFGTSEPKDIELGVGHLNAGRALEQYRPGEFEATTAIVPETSVPIVGWDYGRTSGDEDIQRYSLDTPLQQDGFISITLAWDREVEFANDANNNGQFDVGDTFQDSIEDFPNPMNDEEINTLLLYLVPDGAANITEAVAISEASVGTLQHIFFQIPQTGNYDIWVRQFDDEASGGGQDYGLAWWGWDGTTPPVGGDPGDFDGNGMIDIEDYNAWVAAFGSTVTPGTGADGNSDGIINAADYTVWRDNLVSPSSLIDAASVPEPTSVGLASLFVVGAALRSRRRVSQLC